MHSNRVLIVEAGRPGDEVGRKSDSVTILSFFLRRSPFASLPSLHTVLRNAFRLNTASFLHAVHGSLILFLPTFYGRPSLYMHCLNAASSHLSYCLAFPLYPPWFLCYEHCLVRALYDHLFKRRYLMYSP